MKLAAAQLADEANEEMTEQFLAQKRLLDEKTIKEKSQAKEQEFFEGFTKVSKQAKKVV